ncbi:MAG: DNA-deoxyinosine glycosylase [Betaproteobacteria bacterium]|nr:DNA-deoxyinosine glycosylase [Betaproteobacteria bacterium]
MPTIYSFPPIASDQARILILGSMPGEASLAAKQYYAHPRNAFWPIMTQWLQIDPYASYEKKVTALQSSPVALWDVLKSCKRVGSLDSMIETGTQTGNDFPSFFSTYRKITHVFFNGGTAEASFKRYVLPGSGLDLTFARLPSTSPANARLSFDGKCRIWHETLCSAIQS